MNIYEFHRKMKQHCDNRSGNCSQCCFIDYCYSSKMDIRDDFLSKIISTLSANEDTDRDKDDPIIRNRYNVFPFPTSSLQK